MSDRWELNDVYVCHTTHQVQNNHLVRSNSTLDELSFNHLLYNRLYLDLLPLIYLDYFPWFFSVTSPKSWLDFSRLLPLDRCVIPLLWYRVMSGHVFLVPDFEYLFAPTRWVSLPRSKDARRPSDNGVLKCKMLWIERSLVFFLMLEVCSYQASGIWSPHPPTLGARRIAGR